MNTDNSKKREVEIEKLLKRKKAESKALRKMLEKLNLQINTKNDKK